jgi:glutamate N-acetyltransferase/amino-acid N-acetyltransferase
MNKFINSINGVTSSSVVANFKKNNVLDFSLIAFDEGTTTAAVFTQNVFCAAPVIVAKNHLKNDIKAFIINTGNANAGTGEIGLKNAIDSCSIAAKSLGIKAEEVMPFSTGVIGQQLSMEKFEKGISDASKNLNENLSDLGQAILTTDLVEKKFSTSFNFHGKTVSITGFAKGSGMIRPNMATMLSFIFTDIEASQEDLQTCLLHSVEKSFNRITVDGDTSTNDACTLSATGKSGVNITDCLEEFQEAMDQVCLSLAQMIIKDGEGATKFIEVKVKGGETPQDCLEVAYSVAHSPLVKTAIFASDANWGRILAAVGRSNIKNLNIGDVNISLNDTALITHGEPDKNYTEEKGSSEMSKDTIVLSIDIGSTNYQETVWTCDFSYDYVKINAEYRT